MAKHRRNFTLDSDFYCTKCGNKSFPIPRKKGTERNAGHLKKIYCLCCKEERNFCECKEWTHYSHEDFLLEYKYENFSEDGTRVIPYNEFRVKLNKQNLC